MTLILGQDQMRVSNLVLLHLMHCLHVVLSAQFAASLVINEAAIHEAAKACMHTCLLRSFKFVYARELQSQATCTAEEI